MYGKATAAAVKVYQKRKKLSADGIVGAKTWAVMF
ncbi:peptidoglycan-binding domain-containing protein [Peribacillus castrilensis]|nr:peptidoglycan-binding protein [Brevibacterium sp. PAMC21349]